MQSHISSCFTNDWLRGALAIWCSTCPSRLMTEVRCNNTANGSTSVSRLCRAAVWRYRVYMRDHDPVWWGNRPSERDYYSYNNTEQESTLKQMLGAFCRAFGTEPNPTYLHSYLHGNPAARSLFFFFFSLFLSPRPCFCPLAQLRSACVHTFTFPLCLSLPPCLPSPFEIKYPLSYKLWSIKRTNLFSWGDSDILMQVQLHRDEKGQASRISEYLGADANL